MLATRHDAVLACPRTDGSLGLAAQSESHEFAGHLDQRTYACARGSTYPTLALTQPRPRR